MTVLPVVALEIGTANVRVLVGEAREDGNILITGLGQCPSCGVRKGCIIDLEKAAECVRLAVRGAEESGGVDIRSVNLVVSGGNIRSVVNPGSVPVFDADRGVTSEDIAEVTHIARTISLPHDREMLHSIPQTFTVDDQQGIVNPEKMQGSRLSLDMLIVHGVRNQLSQFIQVARSVGLEIEDIACSGLCAALSVLTPAQKECGALTIDLGAGATSYLVYADDVIADIGMLAVGGDHLTNDIAMGFNLPMQRAELLKKESGAAVLNGTGLPFQSITVPAEGGFPACSIAAADLYTIVNARVCETFEIIRRSLDARGLLNSLGAGVILSGGGARLNGIATVAERVFDMPCAIGQPKNFSGMANAYEGPTYAALLGMIRYAIKKARNSPSPTMWQKIRQLVKH